MNNLSRTEQHFKQPKDTQKYQVETGPISMLHIDGINNVQYQVSKFVTSTTTIEVLEIRI